MRAKLPSTEGFVERDGVKIHYEIYGDGAETMVFMPPWAIVHSRVYKAQVPYFSERFRCITYRWARQRQVRPAGRCGRLLARQLLGGRACRDGRHRCRKGDRGRPLVRRHARLRARRTPSRSREGRDPGRDRGEHRPPATRILAPSISRPSANASRVGTSTIATTGWPTIRTSPSTSSATSTPSRTRPSRSRMASTGRTTPPGPVLVKTVEARAIPPQFDVSEAMYRRDPLPRADDPRRQRSDPALCAREGRGRSHRRRARDHPGRRSQSARPLSRKVQRADRRLPRSQARHRGAGESGPARQRKDKRALYLSSPIGLGHGRRDLAIARELRKLHPDLQVDWLAQDPVTRLLEASGERVHPLSARLASESRHIELESGEHDLHCFQAIRRMDEVLIANFMIFQDAVEQGGYDLVIADEAWDIDHYWHEHPELKKAKLAWFTDFVGYVPMPSGGEHEAFLTTDYNAEMIEHIERHPGVRDRAIFVGEPEDIVPKSFGKDLPAMRDWVPQALRFRRLHHRRASRNVRQPRGAAREPRLSGGRARVHRHGRRIGRRRASDPAHSAELSDGARPRCPTCA